MNAFRNTLSRMLFPQWVLLGVGLVVGAVALLIGVSDNLPGIGLLYLALVCLAGAWIWNWRSPREYWMLLIISLAAFPIGAILHNLFDALGTKAGQIPVIGQLVGFLGAFFFLAAVVAAAPVGLAALIGGITASWKGLDRLTKLNRSYRRFIESSRIGKKVLLKLVNLVRQSASGANLQPLKFILSNTPEKNRRIFPSLSWAGYLKEWTGPAEGERPAAYIIILGDSELAKSFQYDAGIASQSITLGAAELGLGACLVGSINRERLREEFSIPERYQILLVIALGKPAEQVVLEDLGPGEDIEYWRDEKDRHHVPKRALEETILDL